MEGSRYLSASKSAACFLWKRAQKSRIFRFTLVGGGATASYFLLGLFFVSLLGLPALAGNALAYALSFAVSYLGQCLWTFEAKGSHFAMLPKFALAQGIGLVINSCIVAACMHFGLPYEISMLVAILLVPIFVFLICKFWVFKN